MVIALLVASACSANDDIPAPLIASVTPSHAAAGSTVTIAGDYFCHQPPTDDLLACANIGSVAFGVAVASIASYTDASIMAEVPNSPGTVQIRITVVGHLSNTIDFTIE